MVLKFISMNMYVEVPKYHFSQMWNLIPDLKVRVAI